MQEFERDIEEKHPNEEAFIENDFAKNGALNLDDILPRNKFIEDRSMVYLLRREYRDVFLKNPEYRSLIQDSYVRSILMNIGNFLEHEGGGQS